MEAARTFISSPPPSFPSRNHLNAPPSSAVLMLHEQVAPALVQSRTAAVARYLSPTIQIQERDAASFSSLQFLEHEGTSQAALVEKLVAKGSENPLHFNGNSGLWYLYQGVERKHSFSRKSEDSTGVEPENVVALARKALSASIEAASLSERCKSYETSDDVPLTSSLTDTFKEDERKVRSARRVQRQSIRRKLPKHNLDFENMKPLGKPTLLKKVTEAFDQNDPLRPFFWGPDTKLLTSSEETDLMGKIQDFNELDEVKSRLQNQFGREPTLIEWAEAVKVSCRTLRARLHAGRISRDRVIHANYRMVVHIAKQYIGRGLNLQDMLQEGSRGLMKSVEKFKPQAGCRFATYAYWWIRQSIRKAIFHHSRTIRLPDNVYALLTKIREAKQKCIQQGSRHPTKEEVASQAGISVEKFESLLFTARMPVSMQQPVWDDQKTTFQEVTADTSFDSPELSVTKHLMRFHARKLLEILSPKERKIIRLRFGIGGSSPKSLSEIGTIFGLSKERVRQLESRALGKLKQQCLNSQGLKAYEDLLL